jgi:hypothetical protein
MAIDPDYESLCTYCDDRGCSECLPDWEEGERRYMDAYWAANDQADADRAEQDR